MDDLAELAMEEVTRNAAAVAEPFESGGEAHENSGAGTATDDDSEGEEDDDDNDDDKEAEETPDPTDLNSPEEKSDAAEIKTLGEKVRAAKQALKAKRQELRAMRTKGGRANPARRSLKKQVRLANCQLKVLKLKKN